MYSKKELIDFLSDLSNGVNPLTGELLESNNILNNVEVVRRIYSVIELLKDSKIVKEGFRILGNIDDIVSDEPLTITKLVERINSFNSSNMKNLSVTLVTKLLTEKGILCINDENKKIPTLMGEEIGLYLEKRFVNNRYYDVVIYTKTVQIEVLKILKQYY